MYNWIYAYYYETVHEIYISFNIYISWRVRLKNEMRKNANKQTKQRKLFLNEKWKEKFMCTWCVYLNFNIWLEERLFLRRVYKNIYPQTIPYLHLKRVFLHFGKMYEYNIIFENILHIYNVEILA